MGSAARSGEYGGGLERAGAGRLGAMARVSGTAHELRSETLRPVVHGVERKRVLAAVLRKAFS